LTSPYCERAIDDALRYGNALLKFISPNNVGLTGSHECGYLLPKGAWEMYTPFPPVKGSNEKHDVTITWQDGRVTDSVITWYGAAKSEYRLTCFGKDFPYLNEGVVGDMLVLIATSPNTMLAYVLDLDEDIEEIEATLGVQAFGKWGVYKDGAPQETENENACVERRIREFSVRFTEFPDNDVFSTETREILNSCSKNFRRLPLDSALVKAYSTEYEIFRAVERILCQNEVSGKLFKDIDAFLKVAGRIMNRRKSRAGRSFENHVETLLVNARVPHEMRPNLGADGAPDIIIPSTKAYFDREYPKDRLFVVGLKTTCKDRWRQVTQEGLRVERKYLLTLQKGISRKQLAQMEAATVSLVVPKALHEFYPKDSPVQPLTVESFVSTAKRLTTP
jgi:hypothetical protein